MLTTMMKTLGARIRELREERDLSLREFAKKLGGLSAAFLSDIELGRRHPSDRVLEGMARVLRTPFEDLRKYDTRPPVEDLKRLVTANPAYGVALRRIVDKKITAEELMRLAGRSKGGSKKQ
jgi:transcriptional regulator with XRE-family HTH domain